MPKRKNDGKISHYPPGTVRPKIIRRKNNRTPDEFADHEIFNDHLLDDLDLPDPSSLIDIPGANFRGPRFAGEFNPRSLSDNEKIFLRDALAEIHRRENEALRLYEPMPEQESFHSSYCGERLVLGGNRGGKTLAACVEIARAITGQDPYEKYSPKNGRFIVVGKDLLHCSKVIFRKLFKPGAFKIIRDPDTKKWRAYRPWLDWDARHADDARPAPPLIPQRLYGPKDISWENRREEIPKTARIPSTGWELSFFSSLSAPPQGWDADAAAFDEEIEHPQWYPEVSARLLDRRIETRDHRRFINGRFFWSATPQAGTQGLYELYEKSELQKDEETPSISRHEVSLLENAHIPESAKMDFVSKLATNEDEYNVRVKGEFAILGSKIYSEFMPRGVHGCKSFPIPDDWCRYMALDPGRQVCASLFVALPPPSVDWVDLQDGDRVYVKGRKIIYGELYIRRCSAKIYAKALKDFLGHTAIHSWWIDMHAGRITEMGSGYTVEQQYAMAVKEAGLGCSTTGHRFTWSSDDVAAGILSVKSGLHIVNGRSQWLVQHEQVPCFLREATRYCNKKVPGTNIVTDQPLQRDNHLMDCWRYLSMAQLRYQPPVKQARQKGSIAEYLERKRKKERERNGGEHINLW